MTERIQLQYVHSEDIGYGRYGVKLAEALARSGVIVDDYHNPDHPDPASAVCWVSVPSHARGWHKDQHVYISTMWEGTELPEAMREGLHNFERVIVPSDHNVELYQQYHPDVVKVTLGIDSAEWHYRERPAPEREFIFLIGGSGSRKGLDLAAAAFRRVFGQPASWGSGPVPRLVFKSPRSDNVPWGERMSHIAGRIPAEIERDLYGTAHCYLQPSRGEGFGLQPLQAMAQGIPTILTDAHGQHEFAHLGHPISATYSKADYFVYGDAGQWWEPSLDELCEQMRWVYDNYGQAVERARRSSAIIHAEYNWDRVAANFADAIGHDILASPYRGDRTWITPDIKKYPLTVIRPWACHVAGTDYQFRPGEQYYVTADIKRILFEVGDVLDPSCLTIADTGLTNEQIAQLPDVLNSAQYCDKCHQLLGSGVLHE